MKKIIFLFLLCIACAFGASFAVYAASVPSAPSITSYSAVSSSSIKIGWGSVSGATKYKVARKKAGASSYTTLTSTCTSTSYTDTGLSAGTRYYYRVYAINSAGTSSSSVVYSAYTKPDTPDTPTVTQDSDTQLTVTWDEVDNADKYRIEYCKAEDETRDYIILYSTLTTTTFVHKGLEPGSKYLYRVSAITVGDIGNEGSRTSKIVVSSPSTAQAKFTKLSRPSNSLEETAGKIVLSWDKAVGDSTYQYEVCRTAPGGSSETLTTTTSTSYTDKNVTSGIIYKYRINVYNTATGGKVTSCDYFYAGPRITDAVTLTPTNSTSMQISWSKPSSATTLKYAVMREDNGEYVTAGTTSNTYYVDSSLTVDNTYQYYVRVLDSSSVCLTTIAGSSAVLQILPTGVALDKTSVNIEVNGTSNLTATISPSNCTSTDITWTSSDESVAEVSEDGDITAISEGTVIIMAKTSNGYTAYCTVTVSPCSHTYGDWIVTASAGCETSGSEYRECSKCGAVETAEVAATGHNYADWVIQSDATCGEDGIQYRICENCGDIEIEKISATGEHSYGDWITDTEATCTEYGSEHRTCTVCGNTETEEIPLINHSYELTEDTISGSQGTRKYVCSVCGASYTDTYEVDELVVTIGGVNANPGEEISIPVSLENNPGILGFRFEIDYDDSVFTYSSYSKENCLTSSKSLTVNAKTSGKIIIYWLDEKTENMITDDGCLFYLNFQIDEYAGSGNYSMSVSSGTNYITIDNDNVTTDTTPMFNCEEITIVGADEIIKGDVNGDNYVRISDVIILLRYLTGWSNYITSEEAADYAADGDTTHYVIIKEEAANVFVDYVNDKPKIDMKDCQRLLSMVVEGTSSSSTASTASVASYSLQTLSTDNDDGTTVIKAESCGGIAGKSVFVPINITNNSGIAALKVKLSYDNSLLTPVSIQQGLLSGDYISWDFQDENIDSSLNDSITIGWCSTENMTEDGTLFIIEFSVNDEAEIGEETLVELSCDEDDICSQDADDISVLNSVDATLSQGTVTIVENGDINSSGSVDKIDAALLLKYLSGITELSDSQISIADYNSDSSVDMLDVIEILQSE